MQEAYPSPEGTTSISPVQSTFSRLTCTYNRNVIGPETIGNSKSVLTAKLISKSLVIPGFPGGTLVAENLPASGGDGGDLGLIPGLGRSPGGGHDNPLRYSCLENPMGRGTWQAVVQWVAKSWTRLK